MTKLALAIAVASAVSLCGGQLIARADDVPTFNMQKNCKADVQADSTAQNVAACLADEQKAREALVGQWTQFPPNTRTRCVQMVSDIAGSQSYVELLTCLQMARDVKGLPKD